MIRMIVATGVVLMSFSALTAEIDYTEIWHTCDEAASEYGFAEAGTPSTNIRGSTVLQLGGKRQGQTLHIVTAPTAAGQVFCMVDESGVVVHYKFNGKVIIEK